ncbi:peptidoglycan DD-metalloendopeptidase family protein [Vibrio sp. JC009]|uniref:peptidoglycan DD-metalloendopeptidase family protein n=1 Tax=Vibrio sp. JC009 TaxID=2912314 RepID=UPI0023B09529|nr:peptidoglycan DD-metalloendopeptidase family protein [Vibrio sp. JC009]WED21374.1 peptidoglycan DD-metalloendopeptidase family protein [Vibrio sp. JC009]
MNAIKKTAIVCSLFSALLTGCTAHSPAPVSSVNKDYTTIKRGSYRGSFYEVQKGDTLYFIAYITDKNVNDLIRYNSLQSPYTIHPGQKLKLWRPAYQAPAYGGSGAGKAAAVAATGAAAVATSSVAKAASTPSAGSSASAANKPRSKNSSSTQNIAKKTVDPKGSKEYLGRKQNVKKSLSQSKPKNIKVKEWLWPTKGRVIKKFSAGDQGNRGIDIAGQRGQAVVSTAGGTVVYSGNALRGYGNLIIVKHNDNYLSAYAHNDSLLVAEGQSVKAGQRIATMGSSGTSRVKLHFEIRYQGKSVNPKRYLP